VVQFFMNLSISGLVWPVMKPMLYEEPMRAVLNPLRSGYPVEMLPLPAWHTLRAENGYGWKHDINGNRTV
jgi:hypothetical protein